MLTDFNDLHQTSGLEVVKACIQNATKPAPAEPVVADAVMPPDGTYHNTDDGHARRLAVHVTGRWHFVVEWLKFIHDTGKKWELDKAGTEILAETSAITKQLLAEAAATDNKVARQLKVEEARSTESLRSKTNAIALLKAQLRIAISASKLDTHHMLLNCDGVIVDLETGRPRPYSPDLLLTKCLPWPYIKDAPRRRWLQFLAEVLPDEETVNWASKFSFFATDSAPTERRSSSVCCWRYWESAQSRAQ
jgi:phage/plasmid-associated DNA primase